jgi:hypothetical protein
MTVEADQKVAGREAVVPETVRALPRRWVAPE